MERSLKRYTVAGTLLLFTACATPNTVPPSPAVLPADFAISAPPPGASPNAAPFLGIWEGSWATSAGELDHKLVVHDITIDGRVRGAYVVGGLPGRSPANHVQVGGTISGDRLVLEPLASGATAVYELTSAGTLDGVLRQDGRTSTAVLRRQPST